MKPDVVNVFRLPRFIPAIVDEMIELGLTNLWVQQGIVNGGCGEGGGGWNPRGDGPLHHGGAPERCGWSLSMVRSTVAAYNSCR